MTLFNDGLGRTISRDPNILQNLVVQYRNSNLMLLAQAGIEIEFLQGEVAKLTNQLSEERSPAKGVGVKNIFKKD